MSGGLENGAFSPCYLIYIRSEIYPFFNLNLRALPTQIGKRWDQEVVACKQKEQVSKTASKQVDAPLGASLAFITFFAPRKCDAMVVVRFRCTKLTRAQKNYIYQIPKYPKQICIAVYQSKAFDVLKTNFEVRESLVNSESSQGAI